MNTGAEGQVRELGRRWADAGQRGDVAVLDALATDDLNVVGPAGFVLGPPPFLPRKRPFQGAAR